MTDETEIHVEGHLVWIRDSRGRSFGAHVSNTGSVMFTKPSGRPGVVSLLGEVTRQDARDFARRLLEILGEQDQ